MQYSRLGLYVKYKIKQKRSDKTSAKPPVDWLNVALFILLFLVIILFFFL